MEKIKIKKVALVTGGALKVEYTIREKDGTYSGVTKDCGAPAHDDLIDAFRRMDIHLAIISEYLPADQVDDIESADLDMIRELFRVKQVSISGDDEGVSIAGSRKLSKGSLSLASPTIKWGDKKPYLFEGDLAEAVEQLKSETLLYLDGKKAPDAQTAIDFPDEVATEEAI
ncbi:hypothetical protein EGT74_24350 [Chitinophaga lutea]|uniref:Uncharacterized protein n=1 Tax=Chitinophaga lutea TaxID=2488634 RepID=A0A3N4PG80_9BACT|nr:hypothetical protein [Chitinophaga lutea]RPE05519.1 hypothetical protein EGT74_24350 [Chitinophaga lutea]